MKAGTLMDAFPDSYEGDPLAAIREEPPKIENGEDTEEEEDSEDMASDIDPDDSFAEPEEEASSRPA